MSVSHLTQFVCVMAVILGFFYSGTASAQVARTIRISCIDAISGNTIGCSAARIPPQTSTATSSPSVLELLDPVIRFRATADVPSYDTREIEVNAASFNTREPHLLISLAPSLVAGLRPSLQSINVARGLLDNERTIDRGLALMEQIDALQPITATVGTFAVRHLYWRMVALFRTCTLSFYQTCNDAESALRNLQKAMTADPREFSRENITEDKLVGLDLDIRAQRFNKTIHRARWYLTLNDFQRAREEYQVARAELAKAGADFAAKVRFTLVLIDADLKLVDTRERQRGDSNDAPVDLGRQ